MKITNAVFYRNTGGTVLSGVVTDVHPIAPPGVFKVLDIKTGTTQHTRVAHVRDAVKGEAWALSADELKVVSSNTHPNTRKTAAYDADV